MESRLLFCGIHCIPQNSVFHNNNKQCIPRNKISLSIDIRWRASFCFVEYTVDTIVLMSKNRLYVKSLFTNLKWRLRYALALMRSRGIIMDYVWSISHVCDKTFRVGPDYATAFIHLCRGWSLPRCFAGDCCLCILMRIRTTPQRGRAGACRGWKFPCWSQI